MRYFVALLIILAGTAFASPVDTDSWDEKKRRVQEKLELLKGQDLSPETRESMMMEIIEKLAAGSGEMVNRVTPEMKKRHLEKIRRERQRRAAEEMYRRIAAEIELPDPREHAKKMVHMPKEEE